MSKQKPGVKLTLALFASLVISVGAFTPNATANITIDEYTAGSTIARFTAGTSNQFSLSGDILGGQRNDSLTLRDLGGDQFFGIMGFNQESKPWIVGSKGDAYFRSSGQRYANPCIECCTA